MLDKLKRGDVIAEKFPHGIYGCLIVLKDYNPKEKVVVVALSNYMKDQKPKLNDPEILIIADSIFNTSKIKKNEILVGSTFSSVVENLEIIGQLSVEAIEMVEYPAYGALSASQLYTQWLDENHPDEVDEFWKALQKKEMKYKYMSEKTFWSVIDQMFPDEYTDEYALKVLSDLSEDKIIRFNNRLAVVLDSLNDLEKIDKNGEDYISEDLFLYQRCFVVVQGKKYYKQVIKSGKIDITNLDDEYEELLNLPVEALESKVIEVDYSSLQELV